MHLLNVIYFFATWSVARSAKILGIFSCPGISHIMLGNALMNELAARGHEVTFLTAIPQPEPGPNLTQIHIEEVDEIMEATRNTNMFKVEGENPFYSLIIIKMVFCLDITKKTLMDKRVQKLLKSDAKFDVVILEYFNNEALYAFAHRFDAPLILVSAVGTHAWINPLVGNPSPPSYIPDVLLDLQPHMTFTERMYNALFSVYQHVFHDAFAYAAHNKLLHQYYPDAPELKNILYNRTSLVLLNTHVSINAPIPHVPNMIEIGGFHVKQSKKLPADLHRYLDQAAEGFVYFSFGSNLRSTQLPVEKRNAILKVFSKLKQKVLWKWEEDNLPGQPKNVKTEKWLPQQDILAHPNIKAFISHGGMLSTIEAVYFGVPIVGIPIYGDQKMNIAGAVSKGYAVSVPYSTLNEDTLGTALDEILNNPAYMKTAKTCSKIMQDQPVKPLDSAMFWIEYVIRHGGAPHFRTAAIDLSWFQYLLIDVMAVLIACVIFVCLLLYVFVTKFCRRKTLPTRQVNHKKKQ